MLTLCIVLDVLSLERHVNVVIRFHLILFSVGVTVINVRNLILDYYNCPPVERSDPESRAILFAVLK